ncbi:rhomboid family intramembrane serine protease [Streptomyces sp. TRM 70351]|uniref:rhomboid family intramembrane serine protease n=1 Tax=Streptomyces sp. TRM 70351 TaxID=3116552 RepID=UPI002E7B0109|nr:rhomboid family intramembrane serine protease [Streptomyces sp. TRM 70351]MEE1930042.1 rhomboid family intramembrane serine protease [Streptomyces sp. TRM 70351]
MEHQQGGTGPGHTLPGCYRHPERETGIRCTRCERPICPDCMIGASVGYQCPQCVRGGGGTGGSGDTRPRTVAGGTVVGDTRLVTKILVGLNLAVFIAVLAAGRELVTSLGMIGYAFDGSGSFALIGVADGEWYRLLTSAFLHQEIWHIGFNMMALWFLGPPLEAALGRLRFVVLYLLSALGGNVLAYLLMAQNQLSLGASGAVFGLFGATAVLMRRMRYDMRPILVLLAINLVITFLPGLNIAWQAHLGGLVVGAVIAVAFVHAPRGARSLVQWGTCAALLVVLAVVCVLRTSALLS